MSDNEIEIEEDVENNSSSDESNSEPLLIQAIENDDYKQFKRLINQGINVNVKSHEGYPAIMRVIMNNKPIKWVKLLLENGANVNNTSNAGATSLISAVKRNQIETIELLLQHGADINKITNSGQNALFYIQEPCKNLKLIKLLIDNGINVNQKNTADTIALFMYIQNKNCYSPKLIQMFIRAGFNFNIKCMGYNIYTLIGYKLNNINNMNDRTVRPKDMEEDGRRFVERQRQIVRLETYRPMIVKSMRGSSDRLPSDVYKNLSSFLGYSNNFSKKKSKKKSKKSIKNK